jgi:hypothetical protein
VIGVTKCAAIPSFTVLSDRRRFVRLRAMLNPAAKRTRSVVVMDVFAKCLNFHHLR